jgi:hypothetical protein
MMCIFFTVMSLMLGGKHNTGTSASDGAAVPVGDSVPGKLV